jgi:protein involved in polysaccharide export with SLBB domain
MSIQRLVAFSLSFVLAYGTLQAQIQEKEKEYIQKQSEIPKAVDFSKIFESEKTKREEFDTWWRQRETKLQERLSRQEALEQAVDPNEYVVGPDDIFSFNVWEMDLQLFIKVSPEGKLLVPSVGEVDVDGKKLADVQALVLKMASKNFKNSSITLSLEALRFFRVHVVGEVKYPGTFVAQAVDRISEMIKEAGGVSEWAWKGEIELRRQGEPVHYFNLTEFEQEGRLEDDLFVNGGDIIYVPPMKPGQNLVAVEGDLEHSGTYQVFYQEKLLDFLYRIRALKRNTDLSKIMVVRPAGDETADLSENRYFTPFMHTDTSHADFYLENNDRVVLPSRYVYVKGNVRLPGAYPYVLNLKAKDYAGMAGGDFRSGSIKNVKVYHVRTGRSEKGSDILVEPGDVVHLSSSWNFRFENYIRIIPTITSLILAAKAAGIFGD